MSQYMKSGVNIDEGNRFIEIIKGMVHSTHSKNVLGGLGGFAGFYDISSFNVAEPVLVACTDGVGTKLKVAIEAGKFDTVGIDLVAMSVNDLVVTGARPLFFLDYLATGKLSPEDMAEVVKGVTDGCKQAGAALIGGETAEMPGMYADGDFDLAGFAVGIVNKPDIIDGTKIRSGDILVGLASSGFHSNGYSLLRKIFFTDLAMGVDDIVPAYGKVSDLLLTPTRIYVKAVLEVLATGIDVHGMVHITGGGYYDNIPRMLPEGTKAIVDKAAIPEPAAVKAVRSLADVDERELYRVFNMGTGYIFAVKPEDAERLIVAARGAGDEAFIMGKIVEGNKTVEIVGIDS